jgi:hypothetical protein
MEFKFVPEYQKPMITASLEHLPGWELVSAEYLGSYSATRVVYQSNGNVATVMLPYDFALKYPESERGEKVADKLLADNNILRARKMATKVEVVRTVLPPEELETAGEFKPLPPVEDEPGTEKVSEPQEKPTRNRRNKAVSDSKDGE